MEDEGRFQVAVGAIIANGDKILLIHKAPSEIGGNKWEYPVGRIKQFESFEDGLKREVAEETGITDLTIGDPTSVFSFMRGGDTAEYEVKGVSFMCSTAQAEVTLSVEHDDYRWLTIDEALDLVVHAGIKDDLMAYKRQVLLANASQ